MPFNSQPKIDPSKGNHLALWVLQILLAAGFGMYGLLKVVTPMPELPDEIPWTADSSEALVRFVGAAELTGAVGLIFPAAVRVAPWLTPMAAVGLAIIMALAALFHVGRGELAPLPINLILGGTALLVAWGRLRLAPIPSR